MGGKNPAIVTGSAADLDVAAQAVARSAFGMSGQKCNACSRVIITADTYDDFMERLCHASQEIRVGDPLERASFTGPVVSRIALDRFVASVATARTDGSVLAGGGTADGGYYADCTVVGDLRTGHPLAREELFVPLLVATRVDDFADALAEANAVRFGLSAGLFSDDEGEQRRFLDEIEAGIVFLNTASGATTGVWPGSQTMAGWKGSGSTGKGGFGPYYLQQFAREQSRTFAN
jgi:1-pyrroline-5-carboxylate dehydrogenase